MKATRKKMVMIVKMATMRKMVRIVPALEQRGLVWRQVLQIFLRSGRILSLIMIVVIIVMVIVVIAMMIVVIIVVMIVVIAMIIDCECDEVLIIRNRIQNPNFSNIVQDQEEASTPHGDHCNVDSHCRSILVKLQSFSEHDHLVRYLGVLCEVFYMRYSM